VGLPGPDKGRGGKYLLLPPDYGFALGSRLRATLASGKLPLPAAQLALSAQ